MQFSFSYLLAITATLLATVQGTPILTKRAGYCRPPDFNPVLNGNPYARADDCRTMIRLIASRDEVWSPDGNREWHKIAWWGTCALSVMSKSRTGLKILVGRDDALEILNGALAKYENNGEIGGQGGMSCNSNTNFGDLGVLWKIHWN